MNNSSVSGGKLAPLASVYAQRHHPNGIMSKNSLLMPESILKPKKSALKQPSKPSSPSCGASTSGIPDFTVTPDTPPEGGSRPSSNNSNHNNSNGSPDGGVYHNDAYSDGELDLDHGHRSNNIAMNGLNPVAVDDSPEKRRRSVVTFNETTQIIQIGKK
jgi:hypothetical protein